MNCWSCNRTIPENALRCPHCEAKAEDAPTEEETESVKEMLSGMDPSFMSQVSAIFEQCESGEDFVNRIMVGDCPSCGSEETRHCEDEPGVENPCYGRCLSCNQLWCCDCDELFKTTEEAAAHECEMAFDDEDIDGDEDDEDFDDEDEDEDEDGDDSPLDIDQIIVKFKARPYNKLPIKAIRAAQAQSEAITPRLIELLREATQRHRLGDTPDDNSHLFAFYLLAEFRATEALPEILEILSLPDDGAEALLGDAPAEDAARILAVLVDGQPEPLDTLIRHRTANMLVRWQAVSGFMHLVRDGKLTREQAVDRLEKHLTWACEVNDDEVATALVNELSNFGMPSSAPLIEKAITQDFMDDDLIDFQRVRNCIANGNLIFATSLAICDPSGIEDTVEELRNWYLFQDDDYSDESFDDEEDEDSDEDDESLWSRDDEGSDSVFLLSDPDPLDDNFGTIRNETARPGRNEPCPCGSGKKYKKCCGQAL